MDRLSKQKILTLPDRSALFSQATNCTNACTYEVNLEPIQSSNRFEDISLLAQMNTSSMQVVNHFVIYHSFLQNNFYTKGLEVGVFQKHVPEHPSKALSG